MEYEKYIGMDPVNYSDSDLKNILNMLDFEYGKVMDAYAEDIKAIETPNFDPYSFFGERKINKISKKYAPVVADIEILMEDIISELQKRGKYYEEQRYMGGQSSNNESRTLSEKEFLEKEELKTLKHKQDLQSNGDYYDDGNNE